MLNPLATQRFMDCTRKRTKLFLQETCLLARTPDRDMKGDIRKQLNNDDNDAKGNATIEVGIERKKHKKTF